MLEITPSGFKLSVFADLPHCSELLQKSEEAWHRLPKTGNIIIEFDQFEKIDSSVIAVLLAWQEKAQAQSQQLTLLNPPDNMKQLAKLYGIESWIDGLAA
ncbi:MAG: STAS domain-containing protein [Pseudomonadota bacterium]